MNDCVKFWNISVEVSLPDGRLRRLGAVCRRGVLVRELCSSFARGCRSAGKELEGNFHILTPSYAKIIVRARAACWKAIAAGAPVVLDDALILSAPQGDRCFCSSRAVPTAH